LNELLKKGVEFFNKGYYFEAHDAFEEIWMAERGEARIFYQGLVQVSTGYYHFTMKNLAGAESQLRKGLDKLSKFAPVYRGVQVRELINAASCGLRLFEEGRRDGVEPAEIEVSFPQIAVDDSN